MKNKITIPKDIFENIFMQNGGTKKEKVQELIGEIQNPLPKSQKEMANAEVEKGEFIFDSEGIRKFGGKTHEKGGTAVKLQDGAKILSDHLKIGAQNAKTFSQILDDKIKSTDTYAKVLDKFGKKSGIDKINDNLEGLIVSLEKQKTVKDEDTANLNTQFLIKQVQKETEKKAPIEMERQELFNMLFKIQEDSKEAPKTFTNQMGDGGMMDTIAQKYGISPERARELSELPKYQTGTIIPLPANKVNFNFGSFKTPVSGQMQGLVDENGNPITEYSTKPSGVKYLPQNIIGSTTNEYFQEEAYNKKWKPLVENSMLDPKNSEKIYNFLMNNTGPYAENIKFQLKGLTTEAAYKKIKELATDGKPGPFHSAFQQAIKEVIPAAAEVATTALVPVKEEGTLNSPTIQGEAKTTYGALNMPNRPVNMPTFTPSLKVATRLNRINPALISPEQQLAETDRAILGAQQDLTNLSPAQRAAANIGITANQISSNNRAIQEANRFNAQATNSAETYNARIGDAEQQAENQNALSYEARTFRGLGAFENDYQNMLSQQFRDQTEKWRNVNMYNAQNAFNDNVQFTGEGFKVSGVKIADRIPSALLPKEEVKPKTKSSKKYGGRFKKDN